MPRSYRYLHLDVFTDHIFGGNQLAVVLDGRGLSPETMQAIAKEMAFSETTFVLPSERTDTDVRMRILSRRPRAAHPRAPDPSAARSNARRVTRASSDARLPNASCSAWVLAQCPCR